MAKKLRPRRIGEMSEALSIVEFRVRMYRGDAVTLAELLKRRDAEWSALRNLKESLEKAGIKPPGGWL